MKNKPNLNVLHDVNYIEVRIFDNRNGEERDRLCRPCSIDAS